MKAILDTNVIMSGIFWSGHARNILILLDEGKFTHICSKEIAQEYIETANKLKKKVKKFDSEVLDELIDMILLKSIFCTPATQANQMCRDQKDQMFLDLAVSTKAKYIVSGDKDLLVLEKYTGGKIIKPFNFLQFFNS